MRKNNIKIKVNENAFQMEQHIDDAIHFNAKTEGLEVYQYCKKYGIKKKSLSALKIKQEFPHPENLLNWLKVLSEELVFLPDIDKPLEIIDVSQLAQGCIPDNLKRYEKKLVEHCTDCHKAQKIADKLDIGDATVRRHKSNKHTYIKFKYIDKILTDQGIPYFFRDQNGKLYQISLLPKKHHDNQ